jgi:transcriptional regulator with XRE-family HTH domain
MTEVKVDPGLRSGGRLWGIRRVRSGVSIRQLARESGVSRGLLSLMEHGRLIPTGDEYDRIVAALDRLESGDAT